MPNILSWKIVLNMATYHTLLPDSFRGFLFILPKKIYLQRGILPLCSVQKVQKTCSDPYLARQTPTSRHASNPYYVHRSKSVIKCDKCADSNSI